MAKQVLVNRQTTQTVAPQPISDNSLSDLPFYYFLDIRFCILLIVLGIIAGIVEFLVMEGLILLPFKKKNYVCIKCKYMFSQSGKPRICPLCGGSVISEKEYKKSMKIAELYKKTNNY